MMKRDRPKKADADKGAAGAAVEDVAGAVQAPAGTACVRSAATGSRTSGDSPAMSRNALNVAQQ
jgi:hypothetical protein